MRHHHEYTVAPANHIVDTCGESNLLAFHEEPRYFEKMRRQHSPTSAQIEAIEAERARQFAVEVAAGRAKPETEPVVEPEVSPPKPGPWSHIPHEMIDALIYDRCFTKAEAESGGPREMVEAAKLRLKQLDALEIEMCAEHDPAKLEILCRKLI